MMAGQRETLMAETKPISTPQIEACQHRRLGYLHGVPSLEWDERVEKGNALCELEYESRYGL